MNTDDSDTDHQDKECVLSRSGIKYSTRPIPARRRMRNILTQSSKVIANPRSEIESFELFLSEDILRTVLMHTNRKAREIRRTLSRLQVFKTFSMNELKAGLAIILRTGSDRDNFTKLNNLWQPEDSIPFTELSCPWFISNSSLGASGLKIGILRKKEKFTINLLQ